MNSAEEKPLSIGDVYKAHKISPLRRKFANDMLRSLRRSRERRIREGEVYCISYAGTELATDKHHMISVVFVTEIQRDRIVGYNLLYLNEELILKILERAEKLKHFRGSMLEAQINADLTRVPYVYTRKEFSSAKIIKFCKVEKKDWGMIPVMERSVFGNLNPYFLGEDWKRENLQVARKVKKKKKIEKLQEEDQTFTVEESVNVREVVFEEKVQQPLGKFVEDNVDFDEDI